MKAMSLATRSARETKSPCLSRRRARIEKNSSTWFSREGCGGVWWTWKRGCSASQAWVARATCEEPLSATRWIARCAGTAASISSKKGDEVRGVVAGRVAAQHLPGVHVQGGHQAGGAVSDVFEFPPRHASRRGRRGGVFAAARGDRGLLIHRQHQGVVRRIEVEPAHVHRPLPK